MVKKKALRKDILILNESSKVIDLITESLRTITVNIDSDLIRNDSMEGRAYLVVPMVMIVEGVLNGSGGGILYNAEELQKTPAVWNAKPIVVYHPEVNGRAVSACDPTIMTESKIGVIMNAHTDDSDGKVKLKAEAWLEIDRVNIVDNRVATAIENGEMLELSTGLFTDIEEVSGEFDGVAYSGIARNYRPDHLAVLPDQIGACSIEDGAGFIRANKKGDGLDIIKEGKTINSNYLSLRQTDHTKFKQNSFKVITLSQEKGISALVGKLENNDAATQSFLFDKLVWNSSKAKKWVKSHKDVLADDESINSFIKNDLILKAELSESVQYALNQKLVRDAMPYYTINQISYDSIYRLLRMALEDKFASSVNQDGWLDLWINDTFADFVIYEFENKLWKLVYVNDDVSVTLVGEPIEVVRVTEYRTVDGVFIGNKTTNNETKKMDKKTLINNLVANHGWTEEDRDFLMSKTEERLQELAANTEHASGASEGTTGASAPAANSSAAPAPITTAEALAALPEGMQAVLANATADHDAVKATLVASIMTNKLSTFTEADLKAKPLAELKQIAAFAVPDAPDINYGGQANGASAIDAANVSDETPLAVPSLAESKN